MTIAETWHGTPSGYRARGCRCQKCRDAHATRQAYVYRLKGYGTWTPFVDAEPVRQHINMLREYGIGWKQVSVLSGVSARSVIQKLIYSHQGRPPQQRVRRDVAQKILAVTPSFDHLAEHALVPAAGTVRRLQALVTVGWTSAEIANQLGAHQTYVNLLLRGCKTRVTAGSARTVKALYDRLWDTDPSTCGVTPAAKGRALSRAKAHNWAPPAAWDDETIDDPSAQPDLGARTPRYIALAENALELERQQGYTRDQAAERLGVTKDNLQQAITRYRRIHLEAAA